MIDIKNNKMNITNLLMSTGREGMDKLIKTLNKTDYFIAPASSVFHLNVPGGLAQHSLNVYDLLGKLNIHAKANISHNSMIISALLHDVCKIGLYIPNNGRYIWNNKQPPGHGDLSVKRVKKFIELSKSGEMMIRWHMNHFDRDFDKNKQMLSDKYPEVFLIYFADHISTLFLEG